MFIVTINAAKADYYIYLSLRAKNSIWSVAICVVTKDLFIKCQQIFFTLTVLFLKEIFPFDTYL